MPKVSDKDKILSGTATTESLGSTSSAGLTEGLMGTSPLLPNYGETSKSNKTDKSSVKQVEELT